MNLRVLNYFVIVADEGSITKAAHRLHVSQPPLSKQLKEMEEELGVQLFVRSPNGVELTDAGRYLRNRAALIMEMVDKTESELKAMASQARRIVSIGCVPSVTETILSKWIVHCRNYDPDIDYNIFEGDTTAIMDLLDTDRIDLGIVRLPVDTQRYNYKRLDSDQTYAVMADTYPALSRTQNDEIHFQDLIQEKLILPTRQQAVLPLTEDTQNKLRIICKCHSISQTMVMAKEGLGIGIVPESAKKIATGVAGVRFIRIVEPSFSSTVVVAWNRDSELSPLIQGLLNHM